MPPANCLIIKLLDKACKQLNNFIVNRMSSPNIYKLFYVLLHGLYTIFECMVTILEYLNKKIYESHEFLHLNVKSKQLQHQLAMISKKPKHLTIILGPEEPSLKDIANLILWCLSTQISFISFYDYKGKLKKSEEELHHEVSQRSNKDDHVIWYSNTLKSFHKNGFLGRKVHVKILSEEDGKMSVVKLTKSFAKSKTENMSIENISEDLHKQYGFPDPDMGLICGKNFSLYNYPSWQIRITEFFQVKTLHKITFSKFLEHLVKFSKCEQRLGK